MSPSTARAQPVLHPLTPLQQQVWLDQLLHPDTPIYHVGVAWRIDGALDAARLRDAIQQVAGAADALRLVLVPGSPLPQWRVLDLDDPAEPWAVTLPVHDVSGAADPEAAAQAYMRRRYREPMPLFGQPLWQTELVRVSAERAYWLQRYHHLVNDGYGCSVVMHAVAQAYTQGLAGAAGRPPLPSFVALIPEALADTAAPRRARDLAFWRERVAELPPALFARTAEAPGSAPASAVHGWWLPREQYRALCQLAAGRGGSPNHALIALVAAYFARSRGLGQVALGMPAHNRGSARLKQAVGMLSTMNPLLVAVDPQRSFTGLLDEVAAEQRRCHRHRGVSIAEINRELGVQAAGREQVYDVVVATMNFEGRARFGGAGTRIEPMHHGMERVPLLIALRDHHADEDVLVEFEHRLSVVGADAVRRLRDGLDTLLQAVLAYPEAALATLPVLPAAERELLLEQFNATAAPYPREQLVQQLFEAQAAQRPGEPAVVCGDAALSYAELDRRANQLAHWLRAQGLQPEDRVAIGLERGVLLPLALLGVLKAGGAYVPLDPQYPGERLAHMLLDSGARWLLTQDALLGALAPLAALPTLSLDGQAALLDAMPASAPARTGLHPGQLAYLIYTSGSTGRPKGVMVEQRSLVNFLCSMAREPGLAPGERLLALTTPCFDIAALELLLPLVQGGCVVIARREETGDAQALQHLLAHQRIALVQATPATWRMLLAAGWRGQSGLRILCGGEALGRELAEQLLERAAELWNLYGPTETTVWSCASRVRPGAHGAVLDIGRPIANTRLYVLDAHGAPTPLGVPGEIHIGGDGVARGYHQRPELSAERFVADPYGAPGARMYRTGDLGRWRADGRLDYLGRNDLQVKIRGHRIELGEIESCLARCPGVREAVVVARGAPDARLVAYLVAEPGHRLVMAELRQRLQAELPEPMLPAAWVPLPALPLTPNGKVDRKALPEPDGAAAALRPWQPPAGPVEPALAALWQQLLGVPRVGRDDSFFELGGHSLVAVQLLARLRDQCHVEIGLRTLFQHPVLADLARLVEQAQRGQAPDPLPAAAGTGPFPLAPAQQRLWLLQQLQPALAQAYHMPGALRLRGRLDAMALHRALQALVHRHDSLRSRFVARDGAPQLHIAPEQPLPLPQTDLSGLHGHEQAAAVRRLALAQASEPFDLEHGPLLRAHLLRLADEHHLLHLTQHHIVSDGWSIGVLLHDLAELYDAALHHRPAGLAPLPCRYAQYVLWQQGRQQPGELQWWRQHLQDAPALLELPTDRPRPAQPSHQAAQVGFDLPAELVHRLTALGQRHGATLYMVLLAAWSALLSRLSGQHDLVVGVPVANRLRAEFEGLIGYFANTLALRLHSRGDLAVGPWIEQVRTLLLSAHEHQALPLEQLVQHLQPQRSASHAPLFQTVFTMHELPALDGRAMGGLQVTVEEDMPPRTQFDLVLMLRPAPQGVNARLLYAAELFDAARMQALAAHYRVLLQGMVDAPQAGLARLPLLTAAQHEQVLQRFNDSACPLDDERMLTERLEHWARTQADAPALRFGATVWSHAELNRRANRLARFLRQEGVQPGQRVALCLERGLDLPLAQLAVMKAGAAFVPLDAQLPLPRLQAMVADAAPHGVLAHAGMPALAATTWRLDDPALQQRLAALDEGDLGLPLAPAQAAYVIYTSGSTGTPKGVVNHHGGLRNLGLAQQRLFDLQPGTRVLQFASCGFDASVWELCMALHGGHTLVLAPREAVQSGPELVRTLWQHAVTHATLPSALVATLDDDCALPLRCLVMAGEACPPRLAARWAGRMAVFNAYGPTETTVCATVHRCGTVPQDSVPHDSVPIGRPIANTCIRLLDAQGELVPPGAVGEICIGGPAVASGYLNRPALSAERFVADPFGAPGDRLYRSGDLGRWRPDGELEFLGRNDLQVKLRGFRIELGEIEAALLRCDGVRDAAVLLRHDGAAGPVLVAYAAAQPGQALTAAALHAALQARLPAYMLPAAFVLLPALPVNLSGKIDRKALPAPAAGDCVQRAYEAPAGELECTLAAVWEELLGVARVGRGDSFFELGGHSLKAAQLAARLRDRLGLDLSLAELFAAPTLAALADRLRTQPARADGAGDQALVVPPRGDVLPLSPAQQRLWFLAELDERASRAYHIAGALRLRGALDTPALQRALDALVARHESLRTRFVSRDGQPEQVVDAARGLPLVHEDLAPQADPQAAMRERAGREAAAPFDLARGPLVRATLLRLAPEEHVLLITQHHIVSDGWSVGVLVRELAALYGAFSRGQADPLAPPALQYADYAAWQRQRLQGPRLQAQQQFWREQLAGAPALLTLPTDRPRPAVQSHAGACLVRRLDAGLAERLRALGQRHGATLFMTLLAGWAALLARLAGQPEVVLGTPVANRGHSALEPLVGFFVNTLALRVRLHEDPSVQALLAQVREHTLAAFQHQDLPFEQVVEAVQPERSRGHSPLFQAMLSLNNTPGDTRLALPGLQCEHLPPLTATSHFDLGLALDEDDQGLQATLSYASDLFDAATIERLWAQYDTLLTALPQDDTRPISRLPLLPEPQRRQVLRDFNATACEFPREALVQALFEQQARQRPEAVALAWEGGTMSYAALNAAANRLAHRLIALGVQPDDRVALCAGRGVAMVVGMLGILKAGGGYVPLDPAYPAPRLQAMLADCQPRVVLCDGAMALPHAAVQLDLQDPSLQHGCALDPQVPGLASTHLAYVIYTSGSTGVPNGVMVEHRQVLRLVVGTSYAPLGPDDCVAHCASPSFDASTWEVWGALLAGARLLLVPQAELLEPQRLNARLIEAGVSALWLTSGLFTQYADALAPAFGQLRHLLVGGDALDVATVRKTLALARPPRRLVNGYGPTETTTFACTHVIGPADVAGHASPIPIPIGRPIANTQVYILDAYGEPVPVGVAGEIHIGGDGVARGYLGRPELSAERFRPDPFGPPHARLYRTGDLGRWRADGVIEYLGRNDLQVKIRGFRIELGEIEARLARCAGVREACVLARGDAMSRHLVAYVVAEPGVALQPAALREQLQEQLPPYMLPAAWMLLARLPLTPNGKVDRKALPEPEADALALRPWQAPQGEVEQALATAWGTLLGVARVGREDSFFELGGHSLLAVQLVARLREQGHGAMSLRLLFDQPRLQALAAALQAQPAAPGEDPPIPRADRTRALPLSFAQQRLWFIQALDAAAGAAYHIPAALRLRGALDTPALQRALDALVARHESLRTRFVSHDGQPEQVVDAARGLPLVHEDLAPQADPQAAMRERAGREAAAPFDLARGPLVRATLLRLAPEEHVLLITQHHIVSDGWSVGVLVRELAALYGAFSRGQADPLAPPALQYADYAAWQRQRLQGPRLQAQQQFWREQLAGAPALLTLPTDRPRPAVQSHAGACLVRRLDAGLAERLRALGQRHGATLFMTLLAGWAALLARLAGQPEVVLGTPVANRGHSALEPLVGFFVNTLALRVRLHEDPSVQALLAQVREHTLAAFQHQDLPFEQVVEAVQPERSRGHSPLFQAMLSLNNTPGDTRLALPGLQCEHLPPLTATSHFDLGLALDEDDQGLQATLSYASDLFDAATIERLWAQYDTLLTALPQDDTRPISRLPLLPEPQRRQVLRDFNATACEFPREALVQALFEQQARQRPEAVALAWEGGTMSYAALNAAANRLAHRLIALGVQPDDRVALCAGRGVAMVVGMLGILKAGGGYVPLDPAYPAPRLQAMLADCQPRVVLCDGAMALPHAAVQLDLQDPSLQHGCALDPQVPGLASTHLAYVIYTSGSTGVPNGVMVEHRQVLRLVVGTSYAPLGPDDCVAHCASPSFDASTWEVWGALLAGARLLLVPQAELLEPQRLNARLIEAGVSALWLTSGLFTQYADALAPAFGQLRHLLVGGDALDVATVRKTLALARPPRRLVNGYGPTETTTFACTHVIGPADVAGHASPIPIPIGRPIANTQVYILDAYGEPVPVGVAGEIHIGGDGVARGYLGRPELSAERFRPDPFGPPHARLYRTGDLGRWRADGVIEYLGRNDLQVKIRGFRIELGEIEARLARCAGVREACVLARGDAMSRHLVAYVVAEPGVALQPAALREQLQEQLPPYMLPAAWMLLARLPLTPNGKVDRKALPEPEADALALRPWQAPQGEVEQALATAWQRLLGVAQVGRDDHFFELGGHSLLIVEMLQQLRLAGWQTDVRSVFDAPTLARLAACLRPLQESADESTGLPAGTATITPALLPLVTLSQAEIDRLCLQVPAAEIQDIYPLAPLQQGILYHHLMHPQADPYVLQALLSFDHRDRLDRFIAALQRVMDRHDILRTAVFWDGLPQAVQVVRRQLPLPLQTLPVPAGSAALEHLRAHTRPERQVMDLTQAPLMRAFAAAETTGPRWHLALVYHHLILDHVSLETVLGEVQALLADPTAALPPAVPYRRFVAQSLRDAAAAHAAHAALFRRHLGDVDTPSLAFGLLPEQTADLPRSQARHLLGATHGRALRACARRLGVTPAAWFHLAWARVLAAACGSADVVFGTVLLGRSQGVAGSDAVIGMFINTLPLRVRLAEGVAEALAGVQRQLAELLAHEHAALTQAAACSAVPAPSPLFNGLLNYRHSRHAGLRGAAWQGIEGHEVHECVTYPVALSVDDLGEDFMLTFKCQGVAADRVAAMTEAVLAALLEAAQHAPTRSAAELPALAAGERRLVLQDYNATGFEHPRTLLLHQRFEQQARQRPDAPALHCRGRTLSYAQLDAQANRLAHRLQRLGVQADDRVAILLERDVPMVVALLATLKAGAGYVPLDPAYPADRVAHMLRDSAPRVVLTQSSLAGLAAGCTTLLLDCERFDDEPAGAPECPQATPQQLAYVIYTSGSTGLPKGVQIEHAQAANFIAWSLREFSAEQLALTLFSTSITFDLHVFELFAPLSCGAAIELVADVLADTARLRPLTLINTVPSTLKALLDLGQVPPSVASINLAGEPLKQALVARAFAECAVQRVANLYGPSETTTYSTWVAMPRAGGFQPGIGGPIGNTQVYILDAHRQPVPVGVAGEIYIGGEGVARGYMNRPELNAERFLADPFAEALAGSPQERMYRTGDLGRWRADGRIDYLGRNDFQVKIRGFRIELGEIESRLMACPGVREAVVAAHESSPGGDKRLVAYLVPPPGGPAPDPAALRAALQDRLPDYMVPAVWVALEALPLTPNGKVDRKALPAPDAACLPQSAQQPPEGEAEEALARIWQQLLGVERVGRDDAFVELGGHSLLAVQLLGRVREHFHVEPSLRDLLAHPRLRDLAALLTELQYQRYLGAGGAELAAQLDHLTEDELMALLAEEGALHE